MWASLVAQTVKRLSTMRETRVRSLGWENPLEKEMAIHSSTIAWKIPWTEELGRLLFKEFYVTITFLRDFPGGSDGKASVYNVGGPGLIPGLGRSSGEGNGN